MKVRQATRDDLVRWFGSVPATMRALVVDDGGDVIGIAGLALMADHVQAFSAMKPALRGKTFVLAKVAVMFKAMLADASGAVQAVCSEEEPESPDLLSKLGFVPVYDGVWRHG